MSTIYQKKFQKSLHALFQSTILKTSIKIPTFEDFEYDDAKEEVFVSNLTLNNDNFSNKFHEHKDYNFYIYAIWQSISKGNVELGIITNGYKCDEGNFDVAQYKICVNFNDCNNIIAII